MEEIFYNKNYDIIKNIGNILKEYPDIDNNDVFLINPTNNYINKKENIITPCKFIYKQTYSLQQIYKKIQLLPLTECNWFNNIILENINIIINIFDIDNLQILFDKIISYDILKIISKNIEEFCNKQLKIDFTNVIIKTYNSNILNITNKNYYIGLLVFSNTTITLSNDNDITTLFVEPGYCIIFNSTYNWNIHEKDNIVIIFYASIL
jgi:hypothetical protein